MTDKGAFLTSSAEKATAANRKQRPKVRLGKRRQQEFDTSTATRSPSALHKSIGNCEAAATDAQMFTL
jgi:hypothetical protein